VPLPVGAGLGSLGQRPLHVQDPQVGFVQVPEQPLRRYRVDRQLLRCNIMPNGARPEAGPHGR
jgi:hypothetical protein